MSFNPHTHAGCDSLAVSVPVIFIVSIHTPTQGVTEIVADCGQRYYVSIHTPTQGVTITPHIMTSSPLCFNPHTHAGCDFRNDPNYQPTDVSIHTPTQGVTYNRDYFADWLCFNPHTHAGCDFRVVVITTTALSFNPHTHAGCDFSKRKLIIKNRCFNPHTHAGCDLAALAAIFQIFVSIHTPTQGVTL